MKEHSNEHILNALKIANDLMTLAGEGERQSSDKDSNILFGVMRDCAYKLWRAAARQCQYRNIQAITELKNPNPN